MIWLILVVAFILRIVNLNQSLWLDEAISIVSSNNLGFLDFITKYPIGDFHPPLYFALLWIWTHLFGIGEVTTRLLSVCFGVATVYVTYLIGKSIFSNKAALIAALFLAVAPLHIYYSQEARMYALAALTVSISWYFLIGIINQKKWAKLGFIISTIFMLYSDYVTWLIIPAQLIFVLLISKKVLFSYLKNLLIVAVFIIPLSLLFFQQLQIGQAAAQSLPIWSQVVGGNGLKEIGLVFVKIFFGRISLDNNILFGMISIIYGLFLLTVIYLGIKKINQTGKMLIGWILIPLFVSILISVFVPVLSYFRLLFIIPAFYLLIVGGIDSITSNLISKLVIVIIVMVSLISTSVYFINPKFQREDWKGMAFFLTSQDPSDTLVLFENNHTPLPFVYYQKNLSNVYGGLNNIQANKDEDVIDIKTIAKTKSKVYLAEYLFEITDPDRLLEKNLRNSGFEKVDSDNFNGVGLLHLYQKIK